MTIIKDDVVYCDANFLIAYGARKVKQPDIKKRAYILFAKLLACECKIVASALTFDETWLGIRRELGPKKISNRSRFFISKLLEGIGMRLINYGAFEFSYAEIYDDLNSFTNKLMKKDNFHVVQFNNPANGVMKAIEYLRDYHLKPRDSFHLSIMKDNEVSIFISNDKDFDKTEQNIGVKIVKF
jgi:predicted nucleic acid-binding protein